MVDDFLALVVARPGRLREGWRALLLAAPHVGSVSVADDLAAVLGMALAERPELVVLDGGLFDGEVGAALTQLHAKQPAICCLVLAVDSQQRAAAQAAGADAVLTIGFPAAALFEAVGRLSDSIASRG